MSLFLPVGRGHNCSLDKIESPDKQTYRRRTKGDHKKLIWAFSSSKQEPNDDLQKKWWDETCLSFTSDQLDPRDTAVRPLDDAQIHWNTIETETYLIEDAYHRTQTTHLCIIRKQICNEGHLL